jgi:hypothetical protein
VGKTIGSWLAIAILGLGFRFAWNFISYEMDDTEMTAAEELAEQATWIAEDDAWISEEVAAGKAVPARGWLDQPKRGTFEADPQQMRDAIEAFHEAGAQAVWIIEPVAIGGGELADGFVVELPAAGPQRTALFTAEAKLWEGSEGTPDVGQRYLNVSFD